MANQHIVAKIGGSSLADSARAQNVIRIIKSDPRRRYVVNSAPGKRHADDTKITDALGSWYQAVGSERSAVRQYIRERFEEITQGLNISIDIRNALIDIEQHCYLIDPSGRGERVRHYLLSRGEWLMGKILAEALDFDFQDASFMAFTQNGAFDFERTKKQAYLSGLTKSKRGVVVPGFYGETRHGPRNIWTFPRGGSDISGALVATVTEAAVYENWTDVDGVYSADPRIVPNARKNKRITYKEMRELSYMGANVFHEDAVAYVRTAGIPIHLRSTLEPDGDGTLIVEKLNGPPEHRVTGIAGKSGFSTLTIEKYGLDDIDGILWRSAKVFSDNGVGVNPMPGIDSLTFIAETSQLQPVQDTIEKTLRKRHDLQVRVDNGIALICTVGEGMRNAIGTTAMIDNALTKADINIEVQSQSRTQINVIRGVLDKDFTNAIRAIHKDLIC